MFICVYNYVHVQVRGHLVEVHSLLPLRDSRGWKELRSPGLAEVPLPDKSS